MKKIDSKWFAKSYAAEAMGDWTSGYDNLTLSRDFTAAQPVATLSSSNETIASDEETIGARTAPEIVTIICLDPKTLLTLTGHQHSHGDDDIERDVTGGSTIADEGIVSITVGGSVSGVIDTTGDEDTITVNLVAGQTYLISLRGTGANALNDSFLEVFAPGGALVNYDDDGGNGLYSLMTITAATTGTYSIVASSFANPSDPGTGGYTVDVRQQGADAVPGNNTTTVVLSQGLTFGFRETGTDVDRYQVNLVAGQYYTFELAAGADYETDFLAVPTGEIDTILRLRNAAGTILASNDDIAFPGDISSGLGFFATTTGTFYLDVTGYSPQTGGYVVEFAQVDISNLDPLDSINWASADDVTFVDVEGVPTAYVYFGNSDVNFGQTADDGVSPMVTIDWNAYEIGQVMLALEEYEAILGVNYVITTDPNVATFRLLKTESEDYGAYFFPQDPAFGADQGIGVFNVLSGGWDLPGQASLEQGGYAFSVILHEFGHAHGLAHPHDNGGGSDVMLGVTASTGSFGVFNLNQSVYTVMSYNDSWNFHPDGPSPYTAAGVANGWSGTLSAFDIAAMQARYGVHAAATGDTVYEIATTQADAFYQTIWDTGGTDEISYSGTGNATIDLTAATLDYSATGGGALSFANLNANPAGVDGLWGGYTIANGVVIENATGGSGDDVLIGNAANNVLDGAGGNDTLWGKEGEDTLIGGTGTDTAIYAGPRNHYTLEAGFNANGEIAITLTDANLTNGNEGTDTITGVENLQFSNTTLALGTGTVALLDDDGDLVSLFTTIQAAINAAGPDGTILIGAGNYVEQLSITGMDGLTIIGAGEGLVTITSPASLAVSGNSAYFGDAVRSVVTVTNSLDIEISGVTIDGAFSGDTTPGSNGDELSGIAILNSSVSVSAVTVDNVGNSQGGGLFGLQHGSGIFIDNSGITGDVVNVTDTVITDFQKTGIIVIGTTINFVGNTITGIGATGLTAQNGIQIALSQGTIGGNTISGIGYTVPVGGTYFYSSGIIAYEPIGALGIDGNTITGVGLAGEFTALDLSDVDGVAVSFQGNAVSDATYGVYAYTFTGGGLGLDAQPNFTGTTFTGITFEGIHFNPEESYGAPFTTATTFNVSGTQFDDTLFGSLGADTLSGNAGDDTLGGGSDGSDTLDGGLGSDTAVFSGPLSGYTVNAVTNADGMVTGFVSVTGGGDTDTLTSIESLQFGNVALNLDDPIQLFNGAALVGTFDSIQDAIDAASNGYTIRIAEGTYSEDFTVDVDVTILGARQGEDGRGPTRGTGETVLTGGVSVTADGVTIDGVTMAGAFVPGGSPFSVGLYVTGNGLTVTNAVFTSATGDAAILTGSVTGLDIGQSLLTGYAIGAYISGPNSTGAIHDNLFQGVWDAGDPNNFSGMGNGVNTESTTVIISDNAFDAIYAGVINLLGFSPASYSVDDVAFDNSFTDGRAPRPIQIYPNGVVTEVIGSDIAESFYGDEGTSPGPFRFDGAGGDDRMFGAGGDDVFTGGTGADLFYGANGNDTAEFEDTIGLDDLSIVTDANPFDAGNQAGWAVASSTEGTDTLDNVEIIAHAGGRILLVGAGGFDTVQAAVDAAVDGDTIYLAEGTYAGDVTIDVGVTIYGWARGVDGDAAGRGAATAGESTIIGNWIINSAADVTIDGLRFVNDATTTGGAANALVTVLSGGDVNGHTITNSVFWSTIAGATNDDRAISVNPILAGTVTVSDNLISGTAQALFGTASFGRGIWFDGGGVALVVTGNTFSWVRSDLNLDMSGASTALVQDNNFTNSGTALSVGIDSDGISLIDNDFTNVGTEFNFRNLATNVTFDAGVAIDTLTTNGSPNDLVVILGGSGNDNLTGSDFDDIIDGNNSPTAPAAADTDVLNGGAGDDILYGRGGNDTLSGGSGSNQLFGGAGNDLYLVDSAGDVVVENVGEGIDEVRTTLASYVLSGNVENLRGIGGGDFAGTGNGAANLIVSGAGNDTLNGGGGADILLAGDGNDIVNGGAGADNSYGQGGNDTLTDGGDAADTMLGGTGDDIYIVQNSGSSTIEFVGEGTDEVRTTFSVYGLQANVENLTFLDNANHAAGVGNTLANTITGGTGIDSLFGREGNDTLLGGSGSANSLFGQEGDDTYIVAASGDSTIEFVGEGTDTVRTSLGSHVLRTNVENLVYTGASAFTGIGNEGDNSLTGGIGDDFLSGLDGDDIIIGGNGSDLLLGGAGSDQFTYLGSQTGLDRILGFVSGEDTIALSGAFYTPTGTVDYVNGSAATSANSTFLYDSTTGIVSYDDDGNGAGVAVQIAQLDAGLTLVPGDFIFV